MTRPTFITLGPTGTCHENALLHYLEFQGVEDFELVLVEDLLGAIDQVRTRPHTFLVQCSAHVQVHLVTERYHEEVFVIDTFLYPTKELALLVRSDVSDPQSLGIVSATKGYTDLTRWRTLIDEPSKPVVARHLLAGDYDAGLTHLHHAREHPAELRVEERYGAVDTTWVVYGRNKRFAGAVIGQRNPWLFSGEGEPGRPRDVLCEGQLRTTPDCGPDVSPRNELKNRDALMNVAPAPVERPHRIGVEHLGDDQRDCVRQAEAAVMGLQRCSVVGDDGADRDRLAAVCEVSGRR
jgi:hypothetical protein